MRASKAKPAPSKMRSWVSNAARIGIGIFVVWALVRTGALKPELLGDAITGHPFLYATAFFVYLVPLQILACGRWYWLLRSAKVSITLKETARLHFTGLFFSGFLPGGMGGDLVKGWYLVRGRDRIEGAAALGTLVVDRIIGLFGLIGLAALTTLFNAGVWKASPVLATQSTVILAAAGGMLAMTFAYLSPWKPRWLPEPAREGNARGFLMELAAALTAFRSAPRVFVGGILISMMVHFCLVTVYALCGGALEVPLSFRLHAYVAPVLTFVNGIPISPGGLGVGEAAGMVLYDLAGAPHSQAEIPALVRTIVLMTALLSAPAYLFIKQQRTGRSENA